MTPFFAGLATGFLLGGICFGIFALVLLSFKRPAPPPTKYRRKYRDAPLVVEVPPPWERVFDKIDAMSPDEFARNLARHSDGPMVRAFCPEVGGIRYEHLGMTGEEV